MTIRVAVLTVSDSVLAGTRIDRSGPDLIALCERLGWTVSAAAVLPDECDHIANQLVEWADGGAADLILTTGGTGIALRDVTPEATLSVIERELPGIAEVMRLEGRKKTPLSVLSRAVAGVRGQTFIVNLPGSPSGACESLASIANLIPHVIDLIAGRTAHEA